MAFEITPLAQGEIHRDFELDVLAYLIRHKAAMHGCPVLRVESKLDGGLAVWFRGPRPGTPMWEGALRFNFPLLKDKGLLWNVEACGDATLQLLEKIGRDTKPMIQRAQAN